MITTTIRMNILIALLHTYCNYYCNITTPTTTNTTMHSTTSGFTDADAATTTDAHMRLQPTLDQQEQTHVVQ